MRRKLLSVEYTLVLYIYFSVIQYCNTITTIITLRTDTYTNWANLVSGIRIVQPWLKVNFKIAVLNVSSLELTNVSNS